MSRAATSGWLLTQLLAAPLFIQLFLFCRVSHTFSPKAHVRCKEKSGLAESRKESNVGQDSAEAPGKGASKQVRRQDPGRGGGAGQAGSSIPSLRINTLCCRKHTHTSVRPTSPGNGVYSQDPSPRIKQNSRAIQWDNTDRFHRLQAASSWPRKPSEGKGATPALREASLPKLTPSGQSWVCMRVYRCSGTRLCVQILVLPMAVCAT